ncbi:MAG: outer membrane protein transport protein, partial [Myxococcota bacterium]
QSLVSHVNPSTFTPTEDPQFDVLTTAQVQDFQQLTGRIGALWDRGAWAVGASVAPPIRFFATGSLTADFSANVYFTGDEDTDAIITAQAATDSSVSLPLTLPAVVRLGGMVRRDSGLQVELNVVWQGWSSVERLQLEDVDLEIETTAAEPSQVAEDVPLPIGMRDAWGVHLGSEYPLRPTARIRGGVFAETSAAAEGYASVLLPDGPKLGYGLGGSIQPWPERGLWIDLGFGQGIVFRQSIETSRVTQIQIDPLTGAVREGLVVGRGDLGVLNTTASVAMSWTL